MIKRDFFFIDFIITKINDDSFFFLSILMILKYIAKDIILQFFAK